MTTDTIDRVIDLEVSFNIRHMGGYVTKSGRTSSRIIRAGSLHRLQSHSIERLAGMGVRSVIDFRSSTELERSPTPAMGGHGIWVRNVPVFNADASPTGLKENFPGFGPVYERFLDQGAAAYRALAETVAETDGGVLFHCAAGKDRTGVAAALLLDLAGADDEVIVSDYTETARHLAPEIPRFLEDMAGRGIERGFAEQLLSSEAEAMESTLATIRHRWGGAEGYFASIGVAPATIQRVQERLVE